MEKSVIAIVSILLFVSLIGAMVSHANGFAGAVNWVSSIFNRAIGAVAKG